MNHGLQSTFMAFDAKAGKPTKEVAGGCRLVEPATPQISILLRDGEVRSGISGRQTNPDELVGERKLGQDQGVRVYGYVREARGRKEVFEATANPSLARTITFMVDDLAGQRAIGNIDDQRVPVGFGGGDAAPDFEHPHHLRNRPLRVFKMLQDAVNPAGVEGM